MARLNSTRGEREAVVRYATGEGIAVDARLVGSMHEGG
jgi:hypothetical protein